MAFPDRKSMTVSGALLKCISLSAESFPRGSCKKEWLKKCVKIIKNACFYYKIRIRLIDLLLLLPN